MCRAHTLNKLFQPNQWNAQGTPSQESSEADQTQASSEQLEQSGDCKPLDLARRAESRTKMLNEVPFQARKQQS